MNANVNLEQWISGLRQANEDGWSLLRSPFGARADTTMLLFSETSMYGTAQEFG
jgi:hypothetical protein